VIGVFVLTEWLLNKFLVESRTTSVIVSVLVALILGVSLRFIHHYVDRFVDQVFFRARHEHERSLRAFAHEASYITDYDVLLDDTVREVSMNAETDRVSILIGGVDGTYAEVRGGNGVLGHVSENDRAVVKMRTWHAPVDLDDVDTAIEGAWAYPLMSGGDLVGILVCGTKRDGQSYAPDESAALESLAQGVGSALGTLRPRHETVNMSALAATIYEIRDSLRTLVSASSQNAPPNSRESA
jgi:hypothetical protein